MSKFNRAAHCRSIASAGGRATVERYGKGHMSEIGKRGWNATVEKWFGGDEEKAKRYLARLGKWHYFASLDYGKGHLFTYPQHPAHKEWVKDEIPF